LDRLRFSNNLIINQNNIPKSPAKYNATKKSFQEILHGIYKPEDDIKFSKHALQRLRNRNINLSREDINRINKGVEKAEEKGVNEALILMGNKAFIASVKNRTIITAASDEQLKENVFTNIDGAVIV
jgi:flagellar operon protein